MLVFSGAILGLLGIFIAKDYSKDPPEKRFLIHSLLIWLVTAGVLTCFTRKFTLFLAVPTGVLLAKAWDWLVILSGKVTDGFKPPSIWSRKNSKAIFLVPIFLYLVFNSLQYAQDIRMRGVFIVMHDGWMSMLNKVKKLTPADAIICTHWEIGDYVMFFAKRATFYCAAVQQTPVTYWVARALMTDNEKETVGILRMLASGSTRAFDELSLSLGDDNLKAMDLLKEMFFMSKSQARQLLGKYIRNPAQREKILAFMYDARSPVYILLEDGLIHTLKLESQLSTWDFKKAVFLGLSANNTGDNLSLLAQQQLGYSPQEAQKQAVLAHFLDKEDAWGWITKEGWRFSAFQEEQKQKISDDTLLFDNGVIADLSKEKFYLYSNANKRWYVSSYVIFYDSSNNKIKEYRDSEGDPESALFLVQEGQGRYKTLLMSRKYAESVFFKMFFLKGEGLKYLKLLDHEHTKVYDKDLYLYKVIMS